MRRWVLLNPGPVNTTDKVRRALSGPDLCHREEEFSALLVRVRTRLLGLFGVRSTHTAVFFTGSGTSAVEAMLASYGDGRKKVLVLSNGVYGERLADILQRHRVRHRLLSSPPGGFPSPKSIEAVLQKDPALTAVAMVHHETSTGMLNPLGPVGALARRHGKTFLVDAVSSLGAEAIDLGRSGVDFLAGSAGKCLHAYPGVSFVILSKDLARKIARKRTDSLYLDLGGALKAQLEDQTPFTPAVQLFYAFEAALEELGKEGLGRRIARYARAHAFLEEGLSRLGLRFVVEKERRSRVLTALWLPPGLSYARLHAELKKEGFVIYEGQSALKGRIFRVSHMGEVSQKDLSRFLGRLRGILRARRIRPPKVILLAAGAGRRFGRAARTPKCLIPLDKRGHNLLSRYLDCFRKLGLTDVAVVCGYLQEKIKKECARKGRGLRIRFIENKDYRRGSLLSLYRASKELDRDVLIMDADVFFPPEALERLLSSPGSVFLVDARSKSGGEEMMLMTRRGRPVLISKKVDRRLAVAGEATGILKLERKDARLLRGILKRFVAQKRIDAEYEESYVPLMRRRPLSYEKMDGLFWTEMDFPDDRERILRFLGTHT